MSLAVDVLAAVCLLVGVSMSLLAGIGLLRFPDAITRMHAQAKPAVFGLILTVLGTGLAVRSAVLLGPLLLVVVFQVLTAPVGSHMLARSFSSKQLAESLDDSD